MVKSADGRHVEIDFEYLDHHDGAVVEVDDTGHDWKATASGSLKGTTTTLGERMPRAYYSAERRWPFLLLVAVPLGLAIVAATSKHPRGDWFGVGVATGLLVTIAGIVWFLNVRPAPPQGLRQGRDSKLIEQRFDSSGHLLPK